MKIILTESVSSLGNVGDIVNVSPGYARNYLLPNSLCIVADESNQKQLAHYKKMLASRVVEEEKAAVEMAKQIDGMELEFTRKVGSGGKIFAPVTTGILSKEFATKEIQVAKKTISLEKPIKMPGVFKATVKVFKNIEADFTIKVVAAPSEEPEGKKKKAKPKAKKKDEEKPVEQEEDGQ